MVFTLFLHFLLSGNKKKKYKRVRLIFFMHIFNGFIHNINFESNQTQ
jgi:hypothetical protein